MDGLTNETALNPLNPRRETVAFVLDLFPDCCYGMQRSLTKILT